MFNVIYNAIGLLITVFSFCFQKATTYYLSKDKGMLGEVVIYALLVGLFSTGCVLLFSICFSNFFYGVLLKGSENIPWVMLVLICGSSYLWILLLIYCQVYSSLRCDYFSWADHIGLNQF